MGSRILSGSDDIDGFIRIEVKPGSASVFPEACRSEAEIPLHRGGRVPFNSPSNMSFRSEDFWADVCPNPKLNGH
jgi:hypothetical protein